MRLPAVFFLAVFSLAPAMTPGAAEVGAPAEVALQAQGTRSQTWASAAWSAEAKCWLVVWREGFLNEPVSDLWCARVSADGKALDPAGIRLTKGNGVKDRPRTASDGKGFLVVWEDFGNGKDWDVRGARVSGEGKVLDAEGFLVAGGEHNQCRPDVAFAKGNYFAVWMNFVNGGYAVHGARISPDGKVLDAQPAEIIGFPKRPQLQGILPSVVSNGSNLLVVSHAHSFTYSPGSFMARRAVDASTGQPTGAVQGSVKSERLEGELPRTPALAMGKDEVFAVLRNRGHVFACLYRFGKAGESPGGEPQLFQPAGYEGRVTPMLSQQALAYDGKSYLLAVQCSQPLPRGEIRGHLIGWRISPDGKTQDDPKKGFVIADDAGKDQILPAAAGGPEGVCLVVYSEVRGIDDTKLLARIVK